ncbi:hypothetical protein ACFVS9_10705 [Streptomyces sp. NPDC058008]|uniref:MmyB family transcriptional regulator n=1 Tax=Streptomyces sp. NPDC058008 TaxID=3346303 RepID=UPI0036DFB6B7
MGRRFHIDGKRTRRRPWPICARPSASTRTILGCAYSPRTPTEGSTYFARLWACPTVRGRTQDAERFVHPGVGPLSRTYQAVDVRDATGRQRVIHRGEPGIPSARTLDPLESGPSTPSGARTGSGSAGTGPSATANTRRRPHA